MLINESQSDLRESSVFVFSFSLDEKEVTHRERDVLKSDQMTDGRSRPSGTFMIPHGVELQSVSIKEAVQ